jgi:D-alanine-D-alanine ligase
MTGTKLKVSVLYDVWEEEPVEVQEEVPAPRKRKGQTKRRKKPVKQDREEIFEALEKLGHEPSYYVLDGRRQSLLGLAKCGADLVFNLTESYAGDDTKEMNVTAFLDILDIPYTGSGPHANVLAQDKSIAKKMFAFHGIQSPYFATSYRGALDHAHDISFPLIVKPTSEDGSIGIDAAAVVNNVKELMERVHYIQTEFDSPALIEEYIEGREIYAAILGSYESAYALPLVELDLSKLPKGMPKIASQDVKFDKTTEAYKLTKSAIAEDFDEETTTKLTEIALKAYRAVKLRDYGRIDMRVSSKGEVYVIEANPNPWLSSGQEFAMAAKKSGLSYTQMIGEIVDLAMARHA